jgi:hypothetical protein
LHPQEPSSSADEFSKTILTSCSENLNEGGMPTVLVEARHGWADWPIYLEAQNIDF